MELIKYKNNKKYGIILDDEFDSNIHLKVKQSIENWDIFTDNKGDYMIIRREIRELVKNIGFENIKSKDIVLKYCATEPSKLIGYLMGQGYSQLDAINKFKENRAMDIRLASVSAEKRIDSVAFTYSTIKYLSEDDGQTFIDATRNFVIDFKTIALTGTNYGNSIDGIMDYIESTGSYINGGLKNYPINPPYTLEEFITELKNIIIYGHY